MSADVPGQPAAGLPAELEQEAGGILLDDQAEVEARYTALCAAHPEYRAALLALRRDFERAAGLLGGAAEPPRFPSAIGPYRFLRQIGEGAFGVVFLAEQQQPIRRQVAVKLLHAPAVSSTARARFLLERESLARMNHPAIARIFDAGVDEQGRPYFVMEYVPGLPLHRFAAARAASLQARLALFLAACDGVNHAHQRGIIHRDLKPQNILVADVDGLWQAKVIDFGLAKVIEGETVAPPPAADPAGAVVQPSALLTHAGAVLGTPAYMSPEQVRGGAVAVDTRADVYALGVILYELVTGALPFAVGRGATDFQELRRQVLEVEPPPASVRAAQSGLPHARDLDGDLDWILRKAMAKEPGQRYASVADLAADLRRHLAHQTVAARPPSAAYAARKFVRRHRVPVAAGVLVAASLLLGLWSSLALYREAVASAQDARERLEDFWRLADVVALEELVTAAGALWPSSPERLAEHENWLERARGLVARRALHAESVQSLRARLAAGAPALPAEEQRGARFLLDRSQQHLAALDVFCSAGGLLEDMVRRTGFARSVQARTIDEHRAAWDRAIASVAGSKHYGGLRLRPILGLVPLGSDPGSGLEEFAHLQSGAVPARDAEGRLVLGDDTAIVLVLVPGGEVTIGSQSQDPSGPHYDPWRQLIEIDLATTRVDAFLIGKYELTQGQVRALGIQVMALGRAGTPNLDGPLYSARHPEESVLGPELTSWLPRFQLRLPDTMEWEVAARAGRTGAFGSGDAPESLQGRANVADATLADAAAAEGASLPVRCDPRIRDGFRSHAPVGSLLPNEFGLHDVLGNVAELTVAPTAAGTTVLFARGGSYLLPPVESRIGSVRYVAPNQTTPEIGVRVARSLPHD